MFGKAKKRITEIKKYGVAIGLLQMAVYKRLEGVARKENKVFCVENVRMKYPCPLLNYKI